MICYMLRHKGTNGYWVKGNCWVDQQYASIWHSTRGPASARGRVNKWVKDYNRQWAVVHGDTSPMEPIETEVVKFEMTEIEVL